MKNNVHGSLGQQVGHKIATRMGLLFLLFALSFLSQFVSAQSRKPAKVQEVNFEEMSLKGTVRNPEGAFLAQKRGNQFVPLYELQKDMDRKIRDSANEVR